MEKFLKPKLGVLVRMPKHPFPFMPVDGILVNWNGNDGRYFRRRVKCGDCVEVKPPTKSKNTTKPLKDEV